MHGVNLSQVASEGASCPHLDPPDGIQTGRYLSALGEVNHSAISFQEIKTFFYFFALSC